MSTLNLTHTLDRSATTAGPLLDLIEFLDSLTSFQELFLTFHFEMLMPGTHIKNELINYKSLLSIQIDFICETP